VFVFIKDSLGEGVVVVKGYFLLGGDYFWRKGKPSEEGLVLLK